MTCRTTILSAVAVLTVLTATGAAQQRWLRTYGGPSGDYGYAAEQTFDLGYVAAGYYNNDYPGRYDAYLVKTNAFGDTEWTHRFGGSGNDYAYAVRQTRDSGYVIVGSGSPPGAISYDLYIIKTSAAGDSQWTRCYDRGATSNEYGWAVEPSVDNGYVVAGYVDSAGYQDGYLAKVDSLGNMLWSHKYGGPPVDWLSSVTTTPDGGYIAAGGTASFGVGTGDFYVVRVDSAGDTLWTRTYGYPGTAIDEAYGIARTFDSGYVVAGATNAIGAGDLDVWLVKIDANGDTLWTRTYGGANADKGFSVRQTPDSGYVIAGSTRSFGSGGLSIYLIRTDADGDTLWTRVYDGTYAGDGSRVSLTADGGFVVIAQMGLDVCLIKTDALGSAAVSENQPSRPSEAHPAPPNPSIIGTCLVGRGSGPAVLRDISGRKVVDLASGNNDVSRLAPGVYFVYGEGPSRKVVLVK